MNQLKKSLTLMGVMAASLPLMTGCGQLANEQSRTAVLASISEAQWDAAASSQEVLIMGSRDGTNYAFSDATAAKNPTYTFETGKPYVLRLVNKNQSGNTGSGGEHYLSDYTTNRGGAAQTPGAGAGGNAWADNGFWSSVVVHKVVTRNTVFKAPFILDFELNKVRNLNGVTNNATEEGSGLDAMKVDGTDTAVTTPALDTEALVYFVPVRTGSYRMFCSKGGSHAVMRADINIVGNPDKAPDFELESDFSIGYTENAERGSSNAVWSSTSQRVGSVGLAEANGTISMVAAASNDPVTTSGYRMAERSGLQMTTNATRKGYQFRMYKQAGETGQFELASDLFRNVVIRKIHDVDAQFKPVYLESVTLLEGQGTTCGGLPSSTRSVSPVNTNCKSLNPTTGAVLGQFNGKSNPGQGQVDLYIVPQADKLGSYDTTITTPSGAVKNTTWTVTSSLLQ